MKTEIFEIVAEVIDYFSIVKRRNTAQITCLNTGHYLDYKQKVAVESELMWRWWSALCRSSGVVNQCQTAPDARRENNRIVAIRVVGQ